MAWPSEQKSRTRERILASAVRLFSQHGFDGVSIGAVMRDARLTHGGFYTHFPSKQALYAEAVTAAARASALNKILPATPGRAIDLYRLLDGYLDMAHVRQELPPCPLAFLATDVANREAQVRSAYTRVFRRLVRFIARALPGDPGRRKARAQATAAMMIGGVALARALDDPREAESLLAACRHHGRRLLGGD
jgi:TetR/AcrR family transcriptional repressor of nem operon